VNMQNGTFQKVLIAIGGALVTAFLGFGGSMWGGLTGRISSVESRQSEQGGQIIRIQTQYDDLIQRLDRIEKGIDRLNAPRR